MGALLIAFSAWVSFVHFREKLPAHELVRFQIPTPEKSNFGLGPVISPDGQRIAFVATGSVGRPLIWVHSLNSLESRPLSGTEGASPSVLFWSPDSRFVAFSSGTQLKKVDVSGGPPQTVCEMLGPSLGGSWSREGVIIFGDLGHGVMQVSEAGGAPFSVTKVDSSRGETFHGSPAFLPDGRHFIYHRNGPPEQSGIYIGSLDAKPEQQSTKRLVASTSGAVYAPYPSPGSATLSRGHILFLRESSLMAQQFDTSRLELSGDAVPIAEEFTSGLALPDGRVAFSVSTTGVLAYRTGPGGGSSPYTLLTWFDRRGKTLGTVGEAGQYNTVALSPDGTRVAFSRRVGDSARHWDLWIHEFARNISTQLTFNHGQDWMAVWSPDGNRIVFASDRDGNTNLYLKDSSGAGNEEPLLKSSETRFPYDWSLDGRFLLYSTPPNFRLWFLPLTGDDHKPVLYPHTDANNSQARLSPDGRFVAYASGTTGEKDVYVQPFPMAASGKWKIGSGNQPRWRRDGNELFYISYDSKVMAVDVTTNPVFKVAGTPKALFSAPIWGGATTNNVTRYDVTADGKKFLINSLMPETTAVASTPMTVVLNWEVGLTRQ